MSSLCNICVLFGLGLDFQLFPFSARYWTDFPSYIYVSSDSLVGLTSFTLALGSPSAANFINDMHFHMYTFLLTLGSQLQCC